MQPKLAQRDHGRRGGSEALVAHFDRLAPERDQWVARNRYFYEDEVSFLRFLVPPGRSVLELGCGTGRLLALLQPSVGVGVDISPGMIEEARRRHPELRFHVGDLEHDLEPAILDGPFDYILLVDIIGFLQDIQGALEQLHPLAHAGTRIVIAYFSQAWRPALAMAARAGYRMPLPRRGLNWLSSDDLAGMVDLAGFEVVRREWRMLLPRRLGGIGPVVNAIAGTLPGIRRLSLRDYVVARPKPLPSTDEPSVSVVIPCRNEAGNIPEAVRRMPRLAERQEIVFVEGHSSDGTAEAVEAAIRDHPDRAISLLRQTSLGKADAVRVGFENAKGDIVMILDADLTVAPEDLPKFYEILKDRRAEFVNGSRLVYPLDDSAMKWLNQIANHAFARTFSWLLNQRLTDTLCGTKAVWRSDYEALARNRSYFGEFDPFGDYDLLFGASRLCLKIVEVPVRYAPRTYGKTQISRFTDGGRLVRMAVFAWRKMKVVRS
jgi:ubiquinone/menaquinone biosynthesis C-methylase UbiE